MENYNDINIEKLAKLVLNNWGKGSISTLSEVPPAKTFIPEDADAYKINKNIRFSIRKPTWINTCFAGT